MINLFKALKPGQVVSITFSDAFEGERTALLKVGRRSSSKKYGWQRLKLTYRKDSRCCPFYLYLQDDCLSLAHGDSACLMTGLELYKPLDDLFGETLSALDKVTIGATKQLLG